MPDHCRNETIMAGPTIAGMNDDGEPNCSKNETTMVGPTHHPCPAMLVCTDHPCPATLLQNGHPYPSGITMLPCLPPHTLLLIKLCAIR